MLKRKLACLLFALALSTSAAIAEVTIRVQSVLPTKADEIVMVKDFAANVAALTGGEVKIEVLPDGAIVSGRDILDAVDKGLVEAGFAWTHYWSGKHPAAMLFGSPVAGAGVGIDNIAFISWYMYGGGRALYDQLWDEMGMNIKGLMLQPVGPEALGWFKEPINSMADFRKYRFRTPPGIPGQTYKDIGVASVAMSGGDILPALEKGVIDAAEWCCPKPDSVFGFQKVLKHYYLQGLASSRGQCRHVHQQRCLEQIDAAPAKGDGSRRGRVSDSLAFLPHLRERPRAERTDRKVGRATA